MKLNDKCLKDWTGVKVPGFSREAMRDATEKSPRWVHFGAGNIFRGYIAALQQELLEQGLSDTGIIAAETFDGEIVDKIYRPFDDLTLLVTLLPDGNMDKSVIASVAKAVKVPEDQEALDAIFANPSLQMASFTITEKGYALRGIDGNYLPVVEKDFASAPGEARHAMAVVANLLWTRYQSCAAPLALVSMDNCSHNGEKLKTAVLDVVAHWEKAGLVSPDFVSWVQDETKVSFPWTMIDKITPRPASVVEKALTQAGIEDMTPIVTAKNTFIAPFVNAEAPQYLVVEDRFPNGRPALEKAGVYFCDRETVNATERMKVTTCLNPLHTALAVYGFLLGYESIAAEMQDRELSALVRRIGYEEGLPVVTDPGILSPKAFLDEVVEQRLPNPFIPDTPQRIATDTSQKVGIRFGETIKSYAADATLDVGSLRAIPLAIAGWLRYLLAVDDEGKPFAVSSDPMLEELQKALSGVSVGNPESLGDKATAILKNEQLFGSDLMALGLGDTIIPMLESMLEGPGAVRMTLQKHLR